jgi:riboflavin synthase
MFTGIVAAIGRIEVVTPSPAGAAAGLHVRIDSGPLSLDGVALGDSIAINGVCLTVTARGAQHFEADVSGETLARSVGLDHVGPVNLERALRLGDALGGHLVLGHVDGVGHVLRFTEVGESFELVILAPPELARFLAYKGSVTVNGVSLTVNRVDDDSRGCVFSMNLIPHTLQVTTLHTLGANSPVNLEVDLMARYADRLLTATQRR